MNSVTLIGRLGRDPEIRYSKGGMEIANFSIATDGFSNGEKTTDWHNCVAFEKTAEILGKHFGKGDGIGIEGTIRYEQWEGEDGEKKYKTSIIVNRLHFLPGSSGGEKSSGSRDASRGERAPENRKREQRNDRRDKKKKGKQYFDEPENFNGPDNFDDDEIPY